MTEATKATLTVKVSPFGPTFRGVSNYTNDPEGAWTFSVIEAHRSKPNRVVYEVHGEKTKGKGTGAKMDMIEADDLAEAVRLTRRRAEVVGGYIEGGELQLNIINMTGAFLVEAGQ